MRPFRIFLRSCAKCAINVRKPVFCGAGLTVNLFPIGIPPFFPAFRFRQIGVRRPVVANSPPSFSIRTAVRLQQLFFLRSALAASGFCSRGSKTDVSEFRCKSVNRAILYFIQRLNVSLSIVIMVKLVYFIAFSVVC